MKRSALVAVVALVSFASGFALEQLRPQPGPQGQVAEKPGGSAAALCEQRGVAVTDSHGAGDERARSAAIAYATAPQDWLFLSDQDVERSVLAVATVASGPDLSRTTVAELRAAREALAKSPGRVWWIVRPLASRIERFNEASARVVVWTMTILSASDVAVPQADWTRVTVELVAVDGSWRVEAVTETPGPTPMTGTKDQPWQPEPFDQSLDGFERVLRGGDA